MTFATLLAQVKERCQALGLTEEQMMGLEVANISVDSGDVRVSVSVDRCDPRAGRLYLDRMENVYTLDIHGRKR